MKGATHLAIHLANNHTAERSLNWIPGSASHLTLEKPWFLYYSFEKIVIMNDSEGKGELWVY
jgi:hypothetical protein